ALLLTRVATWLLDHGAVIDARSTDGYTPIETVGRFCNPRERVEARAAMVGLLRKRGAAVTARVAVMVGDAEWRRRRQAAEDLITPQDDQGWLLKLAVDYDHPDLLLLLLDFGLDPDARVRVDDGDAVTFSWGMPLYQCTRYGKFAMAEMLLQRGA